MAATAPRPRVFTIPAGAPFLTTLADALISGRLVPFDRGDPLALAAATVLLPTRRAVRAFRQVLADRLGGEAGILPAIRPIGDVDEEDHLLEPTDAVADDRLTLPLTASSLGRRLTLTRLTLAWGRAVRRDRLTRAPGEPLLIPASAADAARLAGDLARLLDDMETAKVPWDAIDKLAPEDHAAYFQITLDFLKIVASGWPAHLEETGRVDPAVRRDTLIRAAAARLGARPPAGPMIAAGSTGSIPATAELLGAIARLTNGAVVVPGLDQYLDETGWAAIGDPAKVTTQGHPQFGLKQLIAAIGVMRHEVVALTDAPAAGRARMVSEAMRPAETIDAWAGSAAAKAPLAGVDLIIARNEQEEATAIALAFREAIERHDTTVALVTPDRTIARRVAVELARWGLTVDDSAGAPLAREPEGIFARLVAEAVLSDLDPVRLLALIKHPFAAFGMTRADCRSAGRVLEIALLRGHRITGGVSALRPALAAARAEVANEKQKHLPLARRRLDGRAWRLAERLVDRIMDVFGPLEAAFGQVAEVSAASASDRLLAALTAVAADDSGGDETLWQGAGGEALAVLLTGLIDEDAARGLTMPPAEYPHFLAALLDDVAIQRPVGADPRVHIWGTLEARLQSVDLIVLGGLDEGVWPAATRTDPWLSRAMRAEIGLPPPERRIGLAAHDFVQAMSAPRVIVTRAEKRGGAPTVGSRWLQRLAVLAGANRMAPVIARGRRYVDLARALDRAADVRPAARPHARPPVAVRPRRLSVTDVETLIRDPYAVYAKRILKLEPLDALGAPPDRALRGTLIHEALGRFTNQWTGPFDATAEARLGEIGREVLAAVADAPDVHAVWSIRFVAIARWFVAWEAARAAAVVRRHAEITGELDVDSPGGGFTLSGRADRIDLMTDATMEIYDFKTGSPPASERSVFAGLTPQMTLEAAMARAGAFGDGFAGRSVSQLAWLGLGTVGRGDPYQTAVTRGATADGLADRALAMLTALVAAFDADEHGYLSRARPRMERARYLGDYDHLARVREWALVESAEDVA